jgi:hypothetical protein
MKSQHRREDCRVLYNFLGSGGNAGFVFYNKTKENIYLNKEDFPNSLALCVFSM